MKREDLRDLGFGTRVRTGRGDRLIDRDGSFTVRRTGMPLRSLLSLSHRLLAMRWDAFVALLALLYFAWNAAFACAYLALGDGALSGPGEGFTRAFFFSVQTASTIGYGHLLPATTGANLLATVESLCALIAFALVTGLTYARFARPMADIAFSDNAIIAPYGKGTALEFRVANQRMSEILDLQARVFLSRIVHTGDRVSRTFEELDLERDHLAFFPLSWTIVHPIDASSPINGLTASDLEDSDAEILVVLSGVDETFSHAVHARSSYKAREIVWNARFANIFDRSATGVATTIDIGKIHDFERLASA